MVPVVNLHAVGLWAQVLLKDIEPSWYHNGVQSFHSDSDGLFRISLLKVIVRFCSSCSSMHKGADTGPAADGPVTTSLLVSALDLRLCSETNHVARAGLPVTWMVCGHRHRPFCFCYLDLWSLTDYVIVFMTVSLISLGFNWDVSIK